MVGRSEASVAVDRRVAFAALVDEHLGAAYRLAGVILRDPVEAEDATHDAVVAAWRSYRSLRDPARFDAWFQRILVNGCRDRLRHRSRSRVVELDVRRTHGADDPLGAVEDRVVLDRAFEALSPEHRLVVVLRFYADLTVEQVAERLGVPTGTVKSRLHHAVERLHGALADPPARSREDPR